MSGIAHYALFVRRRFHMCFFFLFIFCSSCLLLLLSREGCASWMWLFLFCFTYTVDSRYLEIQGTLWNTSRYPYFDISDLWNWGKQLIEQPPLTEWICNLTPKLEIYWKYLRSNFFSSTIFCYLLVDLCVKTGTRFPLRDKRLFEISEVEITRVDCSFAICVSSINLLSRKDCHSWSWHLLGNFIDIVSSVIVLFNSTEKMLLSVQNGACRLQFYYFVYHGSVIVQLTGPWNFSVSDTILISESSQQLPVLTKTEGSMAIWSKRTPQIGLRWTPDSKNQESTS